MPPATPSLLATRRSRAPRRANKRSGTNRSRETTSAIAFQVLDLVQLRVRPPQVQQPVQQLPAQPLERLPEPPMQRNESATRSGRDRLVRRDKPVMPRRKNKKKPKRQMVQPKVTRPKSRVATRHRPMRKLKAKALGKASAGTNTGTNNTRLRNVNVQRSA